jgi:hypothetical protein
MTKPVIVNRATKGTPLTTAEHDQNFTNLQNATVGLQAGTGGTTVTADLNGVITLVAGSGVTFTGDNTAKTITVEAGSAANLTTNDIAIGASNTTPAALLRPPTGFSNKALALGFNGVQLVGAGNVIRAGNNSFAFACHSGTDFTDPNSVKASIVMDGGIESMGITADTNIFLSTSSCQLGNGDDSVTTILGRARLNTYTTAERDDLEDLPGSRTTTVGDLIFNTTTNQIEVFNGTSWNPTSTSATMFNVDDYTTAERDAIDPQPNDGAIIWNSDTDTLQVKNLSSSDTNDWSNIVTTGVLNNSINIRGWTIGNSSNATNYTSTVHGDYSLAVAAGGGFTGKLQLVADPVEINGRLRLKNYTTTQRDALASPQRGDMVYNTTLEKFQGYTNLGWVDLH